MRIDGNPENSALVIHIDAREVVEAMGQDTKLEILHALATDEDVLTAIVDLLVGGLAFNEEGKGWAPSTTFTDALRVRVLEHLDTIRIEAVRRALTLIEANRNEAEGLRAWAWDLFRHLNRRDVLYRDEVPNTIPVAYGWHLMTEADAIAFLGEPPTAESAHG